MLARYARKGARSTSGLFFRTMNTVSKVNVMSSSVRAAKLAFSDPASTSTRGFPCNAANIPSRISR